MNYEAQENKGFTPVDAPQPCIARAVLYSCDAERLVWRRLAAPLLSYALTFLRWIFALENCTKRDAKSSYKSCRFKRLPCSWSVRVKSSDGKSFKKNCGPRTLLWTSTIASTRQSKSYVRR